MDGCGQVDVVNTDFEKAFDRVDHTILLSKLNTIGIKGNLYRWMKSYIHNRSQAVIVGGHRSDFVSVPSGVPQGSLLGPLLYVAFLYDIFSCIKHAKFLMYADDKKVYMNIDNVSDCIKLQADLDRLYAYYDKNRISVNIEKCNCISFTRKHSPVCFTYHMNGTSLNRTDCVNDLGLLLDDKLTFGRHIESITDRAYRNLGFVFRVSQPFTNIKCIQMLYYAYVRSVLEYCSPIWNPHYITQKHAIEGIQAKFIKHLKYRDRIFDIDYEASCERYKMLTLESRRQVADMLFLHDLCNSRLDCPDIVSKSLNLLAPDKRTRHTTLFATPTTHTNYAKNSVIFRLHNQYNKLAANLDIFHNSKSVFRNKVSNMLRKV